MGQQKYMPRLEGAFKKLLSKNSHSIRSRTGVDSRIIANFLPTFSVPKSFYSGSFLD